MNASRFATLVFVSLALGAGVATAATASKKAPVFAPTVSPDDLEIDAELEKELEAASSDPTLSLELLDNEMAQPAFQSALPLSAEEQELLQAMEDEDLVPQAR